MRWIDIILPQPTLHQELDTRLTRAAALTAKIPPLQEQYGLDSVRVLEVMTRAGQELFQALVAADPEAFSSARVNPSREAAPLGQPDHDDLVGYHVVAAPVWVSLPWTWLHNGVGFLFEKHPICAATQPSRLPEADLQRPWMQRLDRARYLVGDNGESSLQETLAQLRPASAGQPEILFVPGHSNRHLRRLIYREAELIEGALEHGFQGETLIHLDLPLKPVTPSDLIQQSLQYQAIHFAGPTSHPARPNDPYGEYWMNILMKETSTQDDQKLDDALGLEGEVLGIDPVTSLLDDIVERYETAGLAYDTVSVPAAEASESYGSSGGTDRGTGPAHSPNRSWLLDDGPVHPENLERGGIIPPLIFSNSYQDLPTLGHRFIQAGASTFIGPVVPLFSRPARIFAGHCYGAMGRGWCAGAAVWHASQACQKELGKNHPAWLSYGIQGCGQVALQYL